MRLACSFLLSVVSLFVYSQGSWAQDYAKQEGEGSRFRPGIILGLNINSYVTNPTVNASERVGYVGGLLMEFRADRTWYLQQEIRFVQKGFSYDLQSGNTTYNFDSRVEYLQIPFLVKAKLLRDSLFQPYFLAGPNLGFNIGNDTDVSSNGFYVIDAPLAVLFKTLDFAVDAGAGLEYHFAPKMSGFVEFRASIGLNNVSDLAGTNWRSRTYQATFGGYFDLF